MGGNSCGVRGDVPAALLLPPENAEGKHKLIHASDDGEKKNSYKVKEGAGGGRGGPAAWPEQGGGSPEPALGN